MKLRRRKRPYISECLMCGGPVATAKGYILIAPSNYSPLLAVKLYSLPYRYAHKRCWP